MSPGPNQILKTPLTGAIVKIATLMSGNTFGARYWTDGKREAPMLPDEPWLRLVPGGGELFWTDECELVGEEASWGGGGEFANAPFAGEPAMEDYLRALSNGVASSPKKEHYVRTRVWWAVNDPVRRGETPAPSWLGYRENLISLLTLLSEAIPDQRLTAAEVHRELGNFDRAVELLTFAFPQGYHRAVGCIKALSEQGDSAVRQIP